jgi:Cytochrome P450
MGTLFLEVQCSWPLSSTRSSSLLRLTPLPPRSMLRDKRFWDEPEEFKPERFLQELKEGLLDPKSLIFGFGRRLAIQLLHLTGCSANLRDYDLPWTIPGKPTRSSRDYDPSLGFRNCCSC